MFSDIVEPDFTWQNFTVEEQDRILDARRSNNLLDTRRLQVLYPDIPHIKDAVRYILEEMKCC